MFYLLLAIIIAISYSFYSSAHYPLLNSDDGVGILMTHQLDFPHDIYFWGQDRLGSLVPLIGQLWTKGFGASPIVAYSLTNYLLLTLGYFGFATFFRDNATKLLFALLWFLPFHQFIDLVHYPIGIGYSIVGASLLLIRMIRFEPKRYFNWKNHLLLCSLTIWLGAGIWMSDLIAVNLASLLLAFFIYRWRTERKWFPRPEVIFWSLAGVACWGWFIYTAKLTAPAKTENFQSFNTLSDVGAAGSLLWESITDLLTGKNTDWLTPVFPWMVLILLTVLIVFSVKGKIRLTDENKKWLLFLRLDFLLVILVLFSLHWVLVNQMASRYFVASYITLLISTLIYAERVQLTAKIKRLFTCFLFAIAVVGSGSQFSYLLNFHPKTLRSAASETSAYEQYGQIGIIADYWLAYRHSCVNPEQIHATPHDMSDVKNRALVPEVFAQPRLFIIGDGWLQTFPDTLIQFKIPLKRKGKPFRIAGNSVCEYRRLPLNHVYTADEFGLSDPKRKIVENGKNIIRIEKDPAITDQIVQSGPMNTLVPGKYSLTYYMRADSLPETDTIIGEILISAEYGAIPIKQISIESGLFRNGKEEAIVIPFILKDFTFNVEYLFRTKGNAVISISRIKQEEK